MIERLELDEWRRTHEVGDAYRLTIDSIPQLLAEIGRAQAAETRLLGANQSLLIENTDLKAAIFGLSVNQEQQPRRVRAQTPASIIRRYGLENLVGKSNQELKELTGFETPLEKRRYYRLCLAIANHSCRNNEKE